jgi:predicted RNA-binding protein with PIN domain
VTQQNKTLNYAYHKKSSTDLNQEIKLIEKKIKQCQRKIEDEKKKKLEGNLFLS